MGSWGKCWLGLVAGRGRRGGARNGGGAGGGGCGVGRLQGWLDPARAFTGLATPVRQPGPQAHTQLAPTQYFRLLQAWPVGRGGRKHKRAGNPAVNIFYPRSNLKKNCQEINWVVVFEVKNHLVQGQQGTSPTLLQRTSTMARRESCSKGTPRLSTIYFVKRAPLVLLRSCEALSLKSVCELGNCDIWPDHDFFFFNIMLSTNPLRSFITS